jgi:hypothetical protein
VTDHDHVHLQEMRQRIYREDQPDQAYEDPPDGSNGVWVDLFLWDMRQGVQKNIDITRTNVSEFHRNQS